MNSEDIFNGITNIDDSLVNEAAKKPRSRLRLYASIAACLALCIGILSGIGGRAGSGGKDLLTYMSYAGPALPLTSLTDTTGITADRNVDFNFSPYETGASEIILTDSYDLTNTTDAPLTLELAYPFVAALRDEAKFYPTVTVDGAATDCTLVPGGRLDTTDASFEDLRAELTDGYLSSAFAPAPPLDQSVIVYQFSDLRQTNEATSDLSVTFTMDPARTSVWTYGSEGGYFNTEPGEQRRIFSISEGTKYLIVLGDDVENMTAAPGVEYTLDRSESSLAGILRQLMPTDNEIHFNVFAKLLEEYGYASAKMPFGGLEDIFSIAIGADRVMYQVFTVTVPAGQIIRISAAMTKDASIDHTGPSKDRDGYDLVTTLGSPLTFTRQTASITNYEHIRILRQNFGFDPKKGVTTVDLSIENEHYYMDVQKAK